MRVRVGFIYCLLLLFMMIGCKKKNITPDEMESYLLVKSNGLLVENESRGVKVQAIYRPSELMAWQELKNNQNYSTNYCDSLKEKYSRKLYFILNMSKDGEEILNKASGTSRFSNELGVISFGMSEYIKLVSSSNDTIPLANYMYSRMYGMSGVTSLFLVFMYDQNIQKDKWIEIVMEDAGIGIGRQRLRFKCSDLKEVPGLKFDIEK